MILKKKKSENRNLDIIFLSKPDSIYAEAYRKLPLNLEYSNIDEKMKLIHITSAVPGENKTTIAINLAAAYLELGKKVLLMDLDLRRPKIHRYFHVPNDQGLTNFLVGHLEYEKLITKTDSGIDLITSGPSVPSPHVILRSDKLNDLLFKLKEEYDYIIIDSPPVLLVTDSLIISQIVDTTLFVVNQKLSVRQEVGAAVRLLRENNANIAGMVVSGKSNRVVHKYYDTY